MPAQMPRSEIDAVVRRVIAEMAGQQLHMGAVMKQVMPLLESDAAPRDQVAASVKQALASKQ